MPPSVLKNPLTGNQQISALLLISREFHLTFPYTYTNLHV